MKYKQIAERLSLTDERQVSLFNILDEAIKGAKRWACSVYVIHAPVYVDEYSDSAHVWGGKDSCLIMFPNRTGIEWRIDAAVSPTGEVFLTRADDVLLTLAAAVKGGAL